METEGFPKNRPQNLLKTYWSSCTEKAEVNSIENGP